jgi:hypothetical protein
MAEIPFAITRVQKGGAQISRALLFANVSLVALDPWWRRIT